MEKYAHLFSYNLNSGYYILIGSFSVKTGGCSYEVDVIHRRTGYEWPESLPSKEKCTGFY